MLHFYGEIQMYCREVLHVLFAKTYTLKTLQHSGLHKISRDDHMITVCTVSYDRYATGFLTLPKKSLSR